VQEAVQEAIDSVRQLAATLIRQSNDVPVRRTRFRSPARFSHISTEIDVSDRSGDPTWLSLAPGLFRDRAATESETIVDPRLKLASIFEDSALFDFVSNRSALIHLLQNAPASALSAIETEVDLHILRKYDQAVFVGTGTPLTVRSIAGPYKHYRAQMVMVFAQAIDRYTKHAISRKPTNLALGPNIDRLREECGWSFDKLSEKTGLDRRLIIGHAREGKGARVSTLKVYAEAFSRELGRRISVTDLHKFPTN
jgi:hypothetical protein